MLEALQLNDSVPPQPCPASAQADQRAHRRHCCGTLMFTRLSLPGVNNSAFAWVHDISESGMGLDVLSPLTAGVGLVFELKRENSRTIRVYAQVVHATLAGSFYRLGCRLTRPLRPSVLRDVMGLLKAAQAAEPEALHSQA
jgi:hypothetical protein